METQAFEKLLLKSAFSCMVCDGDIDKNEIEIIKSIFKSFTFNSSSDFDDLINQFINDVNRQGSDFLSLYIEDLKTSNLSEDEELQLMDISLKIIYSDFKVKYDEIKFFKIIRSKLKVSNEKILEKFPSKDLILEQFFELIREKLPSIEQFLEEDIMTNKHIEKLNDDFFANSSLPQFETIKSFDNGFWDSVNE